MSNTNIDNTKEPLMQLPIIATLLAIIAGSMDGYAYFTTKTFATFQSGNIILSGYTFATGEIDELIPILCSILCFGLGAVATAIIRNWYNTRNKVWTFTIIIIEIVVLILLSITSIHSLFLPLHIVWILAFLAGMQGNAFHKVDNMLYGNIAVTLNVQLAFNYLAEMCFKSNQGKRALMIKKFFDYFIVLVGFSLGAGLSAILVPHFGSYTLLFTVVGLACLLFTGKLLKGDQPNEVIDSN